MLPTVKIVASWNRRLLLIRTLCCLAVILSGASRAAVGEDATSVEAQANSVDRQAAYLKRIKPILIEKCSSCHGAREQKSGLRLDTAALIRKGGDSGPAVVVGNAEQSLLIRRITAGEDSRMLPAEAGTRVEPEHVALLKAWIDAGAPAPDDEPTPADPRQHWSFQTPVRPDVPQVDAAWIRSEIDRFVAAEQQRAGVVAVGEASRPVLLRRLYLNLIGLPPTRDERHVFLSDDSPGAWERAVDRLLASPRYGERWARHFMDVWRYSDPSGYGKEIRDSREHIWRWRDWIVESLNEDLGYDQMIVHMLAADEAAPADRDALRATGFLARNWYKFNRNVWLDNIVEHTSKAFLGITMNCSRCHSHKYDPIQQHEYYALRAVFETHDVRDDPFAGDSGQLVRAYDSHHDRVTYVFHQGDENNPDTDRTVRPAVPDAIGGELHIESIELPVLAYYPALRPDVRQQRLSDAVAAVQKARAEFNAAASNAATNAGESSTTQNVDSASSTASDNPAPSQEGDTTRTTGDSDNSAPSNDDAREAARLHLVAAEAELQALKARTAAELVKYGLQQGNYEELAVAASRAERELAVHTLQDQLARNRLQLAEAQNDAANGGKPQASVQQIRKSIDKLTKQLAEAKRKLEAESSSYQALGPIYPKTSTGRRLALARWIADAQNPLTARVLVNHVWLRHFDAPLVPRMFDLGLRSESPRHQALLDWLAVQFVEDGWSLKRLHKRIAMSGVYRLSSSASAAAAANLATDPDNHLLWRMNSRRMEAEVVRDSVLHLGGNLDLTTGGPPIPHTQGQSVLRRSLYFRQDKERQMTFLSLFDGAKVNECYRRKQTVAPQQALAMFNSRIAAGQSQSLAARFNQLDDSEFVTAVFEHVLCRSPSKQEKAECLAFLESEPPIRTARSQLVRVIFNHNDFVTIR